MIQRFLLLALSGDCSWLRPLVGSAVPVLPEGCTVTPFPPREEFFVLFRDPATFALFKKDPISRVDTTLIEGTVSNRGNRPDGIVTFTGRFRECAADFFACSDSAS
jgi:hypothetical protein